MSYSVSAQRQTKSELQAALTDELKKIPETQPVHFVDIDRAVDAMNAFVELMTDVEGQDLHASVSGSIWVDAGDVRQVQLSISICHEPRGSSSP